MLLKQHDAERANQHGWEQDCEEASGGRETTWQHIGEGGPRSHGQAAQPRNSNSDGEAAALVGEGEDVQGKEGRCTSAAAAEARGGAGAESRSIAQAGSVGGALSAGRDKGRRGSILMVGFNLIWHSPFYRKLLLVWIIISMTWEGSQVRSSH